MFLVTLVDRFGLSFKGANRGVILEGNSLVTLNPRSLVCLEIFLRGEWRHGRWVGWDVFIGVDAGD